MVTTHPPSRRLSWIIRDLFLFFLSDSFCLYAWEVTQSHATAAVIVQLSTCNVRCNTEQLGYFWPSTTHRHFARLSLFAFLRREKVPCNSARPSLRWVGGNRTGVKIHYSLLYIYIQVVLFCFWTSFIKCMYSVRWECLYLCTARFISGFIQTHAWLFHLGRYIEMKSETFFLWRCCNDLKITYLNFEILNARTHTLPR